MVKDMDLSSNPGSSLYLIVSLATLSVNFMTFKEEIVRLTLKFLFKEKLK